VPKCCITTWQRIEFDNMDIICQKISMMKPLIPSRVATQYLILSTFKVDFSVSFDVAFYSTPYHFNFYRHKMFE
jgi:hypothetical protein